MTIKEFGIIIVILNVVALTVGLWLLKRRINKRIKEEEKYKQWV